MSHHHQHGEKMSQSARLTTARRPALPAGPAARRFPVPDDAPDPVDESSMLAEWLPSPVDPRDGGDAA